MKKIILAATLSLCFLFCSNALPADSKSIIAKINSYRKQSSSHRKPNFSFVEEGLKLLINACEQKNRSPELNEQIVLLTVLLLKTDPAQDAIEVFYPFYKKEQKDFMPAINKLSKQERELFDNALKNFEDSETEGNG